MFSANSPPNKLMRRLKLALPLAFLIEVILMVCAVPAERGSVIFGFIVKWTHFLSFSLGKLVRRFSVETWPDSGETAEFITAYSLQIVLITALILVIQYWIDRMKSRDKA